MALIRSFRAAVAAGGLLLAGQRAGAGALQSWQLVESLGHAWTNELVFFDASRQVEPGREPAFSVVDHTGEAVPFQFWNRTGPTGDVRPSVAVLVDLPPHARRAFTLRDEPAAEPAVVRGEVRVEPGPDCYVLSAGRVAVKVGRAEEVRRNTAYSELPAPVQAVRGLSGRWLGAGRLRGDHVVQAFSTELEAAGPLFAQVRVRYRFEGRRFHQFRVRVVSGEDVVLVEEDFALSEAELASTRFVAPPDLAPPVGRASPLTEWLTDKGMGWAAVVTNTSRYPCFTFNFQAGWRPGRVVHYNLSGAHRVPEPAPGDVGAGDWARGLVLSPYQSRGLRATAVGFEEDAHEGGDYLGLFTRFLSRWRRVNENRVPMPWLAQGVTAHFTAFEGRREWGLYAGAAGAANLDEQRKHGARFAALRRVQARHRQTPLDKVKDWVLEWEVPREAVHPCLYYSSEGLARMKRAYPDLPAEAKAIVDADLGAQALLQQDEAAVRRLKGRAEALQVLVHDFLRGGHDTINTYTHRFQECVRAWMPQADVALGCGAFKPAERDALMAHAAFLAYKISDPDYWPYRAYGGGPSNPNMMSIACNALAMSAALCRGHPLQEQWLRLCERLVCADILMSIGPRGAWIESPGYQGAGNTPINQTVLILRNAGVVDLAAKEPFAGRLMSVATYYANLLGPSDPRRDRDGILFGKRMPMALGDNTPFGSSMYVTLAAAGAAAHPLEAGNAVWCWQQMGRPRGDMGLLLLHEGILTGAVEPVPISGNTEVFPGFGVMHRHGFGTPAETFMTFLQNDWGYGHYDHDKGSFSLFAKGVPLCLDWVDYSFGEADMHNRVDYRPATEPWLVAPPDAVVIHPEADYVRARHASAPAGATRMAPDAATEWQRQYILVKDTRDPGDATYLVFRDTVTSGRPSTWNCWTLAETNGAGVALDGAAARVRGQFGVDAVLTFFRKPDAPLRATLEHHRTRSYIDLRQDMTRVQAAADRDGDYGVVLYPVRRGRDQAPRVRELTGGAVELTWPDGRRHVVFLFPQPRELEHQGATFKGRAGLIKSNGGEPVFVPLEGALEAWPRRSAEP